MIQTGVALGVGIAHISRLHLPTARIEYIPCLHAGMFVGSALHLNECTVQTSKRPAVGLIGSAQGWGTTQTADEWIGG